MRIFRACRMFHALFVVVPLVALSPLRGAQSETPEKALEQLRSSNTHYSAGLEALEKGDLEKAASAFQASLDELPQHALASYYLANIAYLR
ncbi:MAG: hypothetical protein OEW18_05590, partial [Candidatus Aminicenantes bacterium]|nr:hypothetical protein [Candidatus Aminicenantes bacterium]